MFVMRPCNHERLFGVKGFSERMFAFCVDPGYLSPNKCSIISSSRRVAAGDPVEGMPAGPR